MKFGVFLPVSGRAASRETLMQAAQQAEALGFDSVWAADRLVMPWKIETTYPYSKESAFIVPLWHWHEHANTSPTDKAILLSMTDERILQAFGLYREEGH